MSSIHLYTELLINIRTVSLFASLRTESTASTNATLSFDRSAITLNHEGESATVHLPTKIAGRGSAIIDLPASPAKEFTLRLQLEECNEDFLRFPEGDGNPVPWSASTLTCESAIHCRACSAVFVKPKTIIQWKDLPSENWAEMMDFWHCHKPAEHSSTSVDTAAGQKGYAAANRLEARPGIGLVDMSSFLMSSTDCYGIVVQNSESKEAELSHLYCEQCDALAGFVDDPSAGWRIQKWSVSLQRDSTSALQYFEVEKWIAAQLVLAAESTVSRKFKVCSTGRKSKENLLIWVFTPELYFSSSHEIPESAQQHPTPIPKPTPTRAMKVMSRSVPASAATPAHESKEGGEEEQEEKGEKDPSPPIEELDLPDPAFTALRTALDQNRTLLPAASRRFHDWDVSLLRRFSKQDALRG